MRSITLRDLEDLGWQRFEDLVAAIVFEEHPAAEKLAAPDGGADVLLERGEAGARAWQAKHFPRKIHWPDCIDSLDSVVKNYDAREVIFVYPRDMGKRVRESFEKHLGDRHPGVEVSYLSGSTLIEKLRRRDDDLVTEFFGPDPRDQAQAFARHLAAEGLQVGRRPEADHLAQLFQLADEAGRRDRYFRTEVTLRTGETPLAEWAEEPLVVVSEAESDRELRIAAWPEEEAMEGLLSLWFEDSDEGRQARLKVRDELAREKQATLPKVAGVQLSKIPEAIRAVSQEPPDNLTDVTLQAQGSRQVRLSGMYEGRQIERTLDLVPVPRAEEPPPGSESLELGCRDGELSLFLRVISRKEELRIAVDLQFALLDPAGRDGVLDALRLLVALDEGGQMEFPGLSWSPFPFGPTEDEERIEKHRSALRFFSNLCVVEEALEVEDLPLGRAVTAEEDHEVATAVELVESRAGEYTLMRFEGEMPVEAAEALEREDLEQLTMRFPVRMEVLGRELYFGLGEAEMPRPGEIEVSGAEDPSNRRVSLGWPDRPCVSFRLVSGPEGKPEASLWASGRMLSPPQ